MIVIWGYDRDILQWIYNNVYNHIQSQYTTGITKNDDYQLSYGFRGAMYHTIDHTRQTGALKMAKLESS